MAGTAIPAHPDLQIVPGARVAIGKDRDKATVRYVGPVQGQSGTWIGLEWDDPSRGKHDGSTGGVKYFEVTSGPTAGSFVRAEKVQPGVTLLAALRARYRNETAEGGAAVGAASASASASAHCSSGCGDSCGSGGNSSGGSGNVYLPAATARGRRVLVELVGEEQVTERQRRIDLLERARAVGAGVAAVDAADELRAALPSLRELDLAGNLLAHWRQPAALLAALPGLRALNLSGNRLALPAGGGAAAAPQLTGLRTLVLNDCGVRWRDVCALQAGALPALTELHLAGNGIASLAEGGDGDADVDGAAPCSSAPGGEGSSGGDANSSSAEPRRHPPPPPPLRALQSVEVLGLEDNAIADWREALRLARLPRLRRLHLSGNPIGGVWYPPQTCSGSGGSCAEAPGQQQQQQQQEPQAAAAFPALEALLLGGCRLASWRDVDALDAFPALRELRLSGNPLFEGPAAGARFEAVARVGRLALLNGADVRPRERRDCELRYLQAVASEVAAAAAATSAAAAAAAGVDDSSSDGAGAAAAAAAAQAARAEAERRVLARHPRFEALRAKYDARDWLVAAGGGIGGGIGGAAGAPSGIGGGGAGGGQSGLLEVTLRAAAGGREVKKKLPRATTVGAVKLLCERLFRVKAARQALTLLGADDGAAGGCGDLDVGGDDTKPLAFFDPPAGAVIVVAEGGGAGAAARAAAAAEQHERRMAEQLHAGDRLRVAAAVS